jgi:hypothetical protein
LAILKFHFLSGDIGAGIHLGSGGEGQEHVRVNPSGSAATTKASLQNRMEGFEKLSLQRGSGINSPRSVG